jgi:hypothetical protein
MPQRGGDGACPEVEAELVPSGHGGPHDSAAGSACHAAHVSQPEVPATSCFEAQPDGSAGSAFPARD